jgi:hypothetical protein
MHRRSKDSGSLVGLRRSKAAYFVFRMGAAELTHFLLAFALRPEGRVLCEFSFPGRETLFGEKLYCGHVELIGQICDG